MNSPGDLRVLGAGQILPSNLSSNILAAVAVTALSFGMGSTALSGSSSAPPATTHAHHALVGQRVEMFGGVLFERVIVLPRVKGLNFVLTATQFPVEVWNAFRDSDQTLESIAINGSGGLTLDDAYGLPLVFAALDSRIYQATVPSAGAPEINLDVVFNFLWGILGADVEVTGSRITLFSVAPDWSEGMAESIEYLTDVLKAYDDSEQRRGLRQFPRRALRYRALTLNARDAAGMESLIWGWQDQPYGVPWWPDATALTADIEAGSFIIPCATADRLFAIGGLVCIWVNEYLFEALTVSGVASDSVTVSSPTQFAWSASPATLVMPVFLARLPDSVKVQRFSSEIDQADLEFIGEAQQVAPAPVVSLTQYLGIDVLELAPNWEATLERTYKRSMITIDPKVGPITVVDKGGSAIVGHPFPWWLDGHPNITTFRAFILKRFGQLNNFWIPTWDQDLVLDTSVGPTDPTIIIDSEFYTQFFFPTPARRFIAFIPIDGSGNVYRQVTNSIANDDGTETLTLDSPTGKAFAAGSTMISFLTLARLGADRTEIKWDTNDHAESVLSLEEVPRELPS
jgi:hypothetical protein